MNTEALTLPARQAKPRETGLTILIDNGVPTRYFTDVMESMRDTVDFVKFGWGTSVVTKDLERKIESVKENGIGFFFGGTLFEKFYVQGKVDDYYRYLRKYDCRHVEISNGTVQLTNREKAGFIRDFAPEFTVLSEVGYKDSEKSINLHPARWVEFIREDIEAGAWKIITEARESGNSGICRSNGELRFGLMEEIFEAVTPEQIVFEAPNKTLQTYFIQKIGPHVNLANVPFGDAIPLETLRLGLRSDTLLFFEEADAL